MKFHVNTFAPMKAVYTFMYPEAFAVYKAVQALMTEELFHVSTTAARAHELLRQLVDPALEVPNTDGWFDLDELHNFVRRRLISAYAGPLPALKDFPHAYPTAGSSEGIFHLLTHLKVNGLKWINVFKGEYEGYAAQAENLKLGCGHWRPEEAAALSPRHWFISNPSAINGNILPPELLQEMLDRDHKIVLDLAYVGATAPTVFDISHPNITAVVMSFSKPYGMFRMRAGGQVLSRRPASSLYGNKWFNDSERQLLAAKLAVDIGPSGLYPKYRPVQEAIVTALNETFGLEIQPSDNLLTACMPASSAERLQFRGGVQKSDLAKFRREGWYRFCLTPYYEQARQQWLF